MSKLLAAICGEGSGPRIVRRAFLLAASRGTLFVSTVVTAIVGCAIVAGAIVWIAGAIVWAGVGAAAVERAADRAGYRAKSTAKHVPVGKASTAIRRLSVIWRLTVIIAGIVVIYFCERGGTALQGDAIEKPARRWLASTGRVRPRQKP